VWRIRRHGRVFDRALSVRCARFGAETGLAENIEVTVLNIAKDCTYILAPATAYGKNITPRIGAKLDVAQISDITTADLPDTFERPVYGFMAGRSGSP
jgi:electron transfer flavoprotein alpha subunit